MLHVEIRGHIFFFINKSLGRTFKLDQETHEPDPEIVSLNADLVGFDEELATHLLPTQQLYVNKNDSAAQYMLTIYKDSSQLVLPLFSSNQ
jgi:hypothetical protein